MTDDRPKCPTCTSPAPHLHPAVQHGGECHICKDPFHRRVTPENTVECIRSLGLEPMTDTALHKCALCGEVCPHTSATGYEIWTEQHHAVCEKRPIAPGDYVRGDGTGWWAAGPVENPTYRTAGGRTLVQFRVKDGNANRGLLLHFAPDKVRRIPRPGAGEQAIELDCYVEWKPDGSRSRAAGQVVKMDGDRAIVRIREVSQTWTAFEACPFSGHARSIPLAQLQRIPWPHETPVAQPRGGQHDPPAECRPTSLGSGYQHPGLEHAVPPAPVLVDGITVPECDAQWGVNRYRLEAGLPLRYALTDAQVAAGRAAWQARNLPMVSALVNARIEAAEARAANPVRVEIQDVDP